MVPSIPTGSFLPTGGEPDGLSTRVSRALSEAQRLILTEKITGAAAMRITAMISQAQQSSGQGNLRDADRLARQALGLAKDAAGPPVEGAPDKEDDSPVPEAAKNPDETDKGNQQGFSQQETTSYQDASNDSGVSFQSAQPLTNAQAPFAVQLHEMSHVRRETSDAILHGQRVLTAVTIHSHIDPQTGERHVDGGQARVVVFPNIKTVTPTGNNIDLEA